MLKVIYEILGRIPRTARPAWRLFSTSPTLSTLSRLWQGCGKFPACMRCRGCRRFRSSGQCSDLNSQASVEIVLDISDLKHLEQIMAGLRKIPGVHEVQRLQKI